MHTEITLFCAKKQYEGAQNSLGEFFPKLLCHFAGKTEDVIFFHKHQLTVFYHNLTIGNDMQHMAGIKAMDQVAGEVFCSNRGGAVIIKDDEVVVAIAPEFVLFQVMMHISQALVCFVGAHVFTFYPAVIGVLCTADHVAVKSSGAKENAWPKIQGIKITRHVAQVALNIFDNPGFRFPDYFLFGGLEMQAVSQDTLWAIQNTKSSKPPGNVLVMVVLAVGLVVLIFSNMDVSA